MQRVKKEKIQEILDAQNAVIDADMVCMLQKTLLNIITLACYIYMCTDLNGQNKKGKGRLTYLLQQTELFAHFAKGNQSASQKKAKGKCVNYFIYSLIFWVNSRRVFLQYSFGN